nr:PREDICTED: centrosomal protein POC5 isoform X1 [Lepisosteus oculatus]
MSSDEAEPNSPVLPKDSDRGSSVSSELQDEYEELLRYAVVTPKFEPSALRQSQHGSQLTADGRITSLVDDVLSQHSAGSASEHEESRHKELKAQRAPTTEMEPGAQLEMLEGQEAPIRILFESDVESGNMKTPSERSLQRTPDNLVTEIFVSEENINRMENILDIWGNNLKENVMMELRKWKVSFIEQHRRELKKEREKHASQMAEFVTEMDNLKELLHTYEISNQRKDEVISNLTQGIERQREKLELMRTFTHWRIQHSEAREEAYANSLADQHYRLMLKKKVWAAWHSVIEVNWRERVERACQARAEEVCHQLSSDYAAKMAELSEELSNARGEIQRLHSERDRYEDSMKKAFMRGVCALNMEAMSMFHGRESRLESDRPPSREEPSSSSSAPFPPQPAPSARFSPVHLEPPGPPASSSDAEQMFISHFGPSSAASRTADCISSATVVNSAAPTSGPVSAHRLPTTRVVTSSQQKASKTITARITGRTDLGPKSSRVTGNLSVMGVAPPMSSVVVERHHPVTQLTIGQATAAKYPRSTNHSSAPATAGKGSTHAGRAHHSSSNIQSIKVVE